MKTIGVAAQWFIQLPLNPEVVGSSQSWTIRDRCKIILKYTITFQIAQNNDTAYLINK